MLDFTTQIRGKIEPFAFDPVGGRASCKRPAIRNKGMDLRLSGDVRVTTTASRYHKGGTAERWCCLPVKASNGQLYLCFWTALLPPRTPSSPNMTSHGTYPSLVWIMVRPPWTPTAPRLSETRAAAETEARRVLDPYICRGIRPVTRPIWDQIVVPPRYERDDATYRQFYVREWNKLLSGTSRAGRSGRGR